MSKNTVFINLHGSVVFNNQLSFFGNKYEDTKSGRNKAFRDIVEIIESKKTLKLKNKNAEYILVFKAKISGDIIYCQLAKKTPMEMFELTENNIKSNLIDSYPPLDVFINLKCQQFAIEISNSKIPIESLLNVFQRMLNNLTKDFNIFVNAIKDKKDFWDLISNDNSISEITFDLVVPNYFDVSGSAKNLVASAKDSLNADNVSLCIKNKKGKLKASIEAIDSFVKYSSSSGSWRLKIKESGSSQYRVYKSCDFYKKREIETEILDLIKKENYTSNTQIYTELINKLKGLFENGEENQKLS